MPAGNASNTIFTSIPVGEDFFMSFSTQRFHRNIAPQDIEYLNFKLYDARIIGDVGNPNPNAIIVEYNNQPSTGEDYSDEDTANPNGRPSFFKILSDAVAVFVASADLDTYEQAKVKNNTAVFRGEVYGYIEAVVTGEETKYSRLVTLPIKGKLIATAEFESTVDDNAWWDTYFYREDIRKIKNKLIVNSPALSVVTSS